MTRPDNARASAPASVDADLEVSPRRSFYRAQHPRGGAAGHLQTDADQAVGQLRSDWPSIGGRDMGGGECFIRCNPPRFEQVIPRRFTILM